MWIETGEPRHSTSLAPTNERKNGQILESLTEVLKDSSRRTHGNFPHVILLLAAEDMLCESADKKRERSYA